MLKGETRNGMAALILDSLPTDANLVRVHVSGDFFSDTYFQAWMDVAKARPEMLFYGYTKSLPIWLRNRSSVPANFKLTASEGGKYDDLIESESLKSAKVLFSMMTATPTPLTDRLPYYCTAPSEKRRLLQRPCQHYGKQVIMGTPGNPAQSERTVLRTTLTEDPSNN